MGRAPCCSKEGLHRGPWTSREDALLTSYIHTHGEGNWSSLPKKAGLLRCGKSCRLRWMNYLRPDIKRGNIGPEEEDLIIRLHRLLGNRWSLIAGRLPGRTDNEIKNYWNSHLSKKLKRQGVMVREATPRSRQAKASSHSKKRNSSDDSSHESAKIYAPKPTRLSAGFVVESGGEEERIASDHEENGSDMIDHEAGNVELTADEWSVCHGFLDTDFLFLDQINFGGQIPPTLQDDGTIGRVYDEFSQLLESEMDMNLFAHHDYQYLLV